MTYVHKEKPNVTITDAKGLSLAQIDTALLVLNTLRNNLLSSIDKELDIN